MRAGKFKIKVLVDSVSDEELFPVSSHGGEREQEETFSLVSLVIVALMA